MVANQYLLANLHECTHATNHLLYLNITIVLPLFTRAYIDKMKSHITEIAKKIIAVLIVLVVVAWFYWDSRSSPVLLVIPNHYEGYVTIIEDRNNFDLYYPKALEVSEVLEYYVGDDKSLRVESIKPFLNWPHNIRVGYEWVEPLVHYQDSMHPNWAVYGDLHKVSNSHYRFWTGPRKHLPKTEQATIQHEQDNKRAQ